MFVSGRDALSSVEDAISTVRANETHLSQVLASASQESGRQRQHLTEAYRALALIRLDALVRNEAVGELDAAERRALELLRAYKAQLDQLLIRHGGAQAAVMAAQADHRASTASVEAAGEPIKALQAQIGKQLATDSVWTSRRARVDEATKIATAGDAKADQAEADREIKRKPYEADPLFMYLWKRNFAAPEYHAGNLARFFDRKVAALVGYDAARPNYMSLLEIPQRLREHANDLVSQAGAQDHALEQIERDALTNGGILPLETTLVTAQAALKVAGDALSKAQSALAALDQERARLTGEGDRRAHDEALAVLAQAISREDVQTMYREAQATRTPDDDRLVQQIEQTQKAIGAADAEVARIRDEAREIARRRSELETVRDNFRRKQYDSPWGQVEVDHTDALGDLIGGIVKGAVQGAVLWSLFERGYRRRDWDGGGFGGSQPSPRFRLPSSSFPKIGGGGFKTGGGFKGGGFRTGGKF